MKNEIQNQKIFNRRGWTEIFLEGLEGFFRGTRGAITSLSLSLLIS